MYKNTESTDSMPWSNAYYSTKRLKKVNMSRSARKNYKELKNINVRLKELNSMHKKTAFLFELSFVASK